MRIPFVLSLLLIATPAIAETEHCPEQSCAVKRATALHAFITGATSTVDIPTECRTDLPLS